MIGLKLRVIWFECNALGLINPKTFQDWQLNDGMFQIYGPL